MWRYVTAGSVVLFALNAFLCHELFTTGFTDHLDSIEGTFISLPRFIQENWPNLDWFQWWYGGIPFQNTYRPLLHMIVAGWNWLTEPADTIPVLAYHQVTGFLYSLGPITLFWAAMGISGRFWTSFGAALGYSLFSPAVFLLSWHNHDIGKPVRLQNLVQFGEGPHTAGLMLLPLALLALHRAVEKRTPGRIYLAAIALAAVVLTNMIAGFALAVLAVIYLIARFGDTSATGMAGILQWLRIVGISAACALIGFALTLPWNPPSTLGDIARNGGSMSGAYGISTTEILSILGLIALAGGTVWLTLRYKLELMTRIAILMSIAYCGIVLAHQALDVTLIPQPDRYAVEAELGLWLVAAFTLERIASRIPLRVRMMLPAGIGILVMIQIVSYRDYAEATITPVEIEETLEYEAANWFDKDWHPEPILEEEDEVTEDEVQEIEEPEINDEQPAHALDRARPIVGVEGWVIAIENSPEDATDLPPARTEPEPEPEELNTEMPNLPIPRGRVFLKGSTAFWFNVFTDTPRFNGGADQGAVNPMYPRVNYGISYTEEDGERTAAWLRAYGVEAVMVMGEDTRDSYKDWRDPAKFEDLLEEIWRDGDDVIYAVPQRTDVPGFPLVDKPDPEIESDFSPPQQTAFLAHVVRPEDVIQIEPENVEDGAAVEEFVKVLDDPEVPAAAFRWEASNRARIYGDLAPGDLYYVQVSYHPGWHAYRDGLSAPIVRDALGQMVVEPRCAGPCEVELVFDGGREMLISQAIMWIAIVSGLVWWGMSRRTAS